MKKPARAPLTPTDLPMGILLAAGFGRRFDPAVVNAFLSREEAFMAARAGQLSVGSHT